MSRALRERSVEFVWCGVLGAFLRVFWRVWVCAPADLPPAQGYRIGRVEATTGHCDARSPTPFFTVFRLFWVRVKRRGAGITPRPSSLTIFSYELLRSALPYMASFSTK